MDSPVWYNEYAHMICVPTILNFISPFDGSHLSKKMAPLRESDLDPNRTGPSPSFIQVAKPYIFEHTIQECLKLTGVTQAREDQLRLSGVQWIDSVRKSLRLPVRTFDTAVVYYHKFRLAHSDTEYSHVDAAAAALFTACKIEDTLKKSRDIICAAHNLRLPVNEHLSPDDTLFEIHARAIIGLERLMLEASSFDFRNRHPQQLVIKLAKHYGIERRSDLAKTAYQVSLDIYRTFAPLKQTTAALAFACLELAGRLLNHHNPAIESSDDYDTWQISRAMVMETLLDLLELYTHYRNNTTVGPDFPVEVFLEVRIPLNQEMDAKHLPRFTEWKDRHKKPSITNGAAAKASSSSSTNGTTTKPSPKESLHPVVSPSTPAIVANGASTRGRIGERGRDGTVRFMLNPEREQEERATVAEYFKPVEVIEEEVEEEYVDEDEDGVEDIEVDDHHDDRRR